MNLETNVKPQIKKSWAQITEVFRPEVTETKCTETNSTDKNGWKTIGKGPKGEKTQEDEKT